MLFLTELRFSACLIFAVRAYINQMSKKDLNAISLSWHLTFFICHDMTIRLLTSCIYRSFLILYHILLYLLVLPCLLWSRSFFTLSTATISGFLASLMWSDYTVKSHRTLKFLKYLAQWPTKWDKAAGQEVL